MSACVFFLVFSLLGSVPSFFMILFVKFQKFIRNYKVKGKKVLWKSSEKSAKETKQNLKKAKIVYLKGGAW